MHHNYVCRLISAHAKPSTVQVAGDSCKVWGEVPHQTLAGEELLPHVQGTHTLLQCKQQMGSLRQIKTDRPREMIMAVIAAG